MKRRSANLARPALRDLERTVQSYDPKNAQRNLKIAPIGKWRRVYILDEVGGGGGGGDFFGSCNLI